MKLDTNIFYRSSIVVLKIVGFLPSFNNYKLNSMWKISTRVILSLLATTHFRNECALHVTNLVCFTKNMRLFEGLQNVVLTRKANITIL